jgi:hypothetical protein
MIFVNNSVFEIAVELFYNIIQYDKKNLPGTFFKKLMNFKATFF